MENLQGLVPLFTLSQSKGWIEAFNSVLLTGSIESDNFQNHLSGQI